MNDRQETEPSVLDTQDSAGKPTDADSPDQGDLKQELKVALESLQEATAKQADNWELYIRTRADLENAQRRGRMDVENAHKYSSEKIAREILAVADSLERGIDAAEQSGVDAKNPLREGMALTHKLLLDILDKFGIKQSNPLNETFNPALHEAISMQESSSLEPNKIVTVVQRGFTLHERVLRPARVIVTRAAHNNKVDEKA